MAAITPISGSIVNSVFGDQRSISAKFSSVASTNTWTPGFGVIVGVDVTSGSGNTISVAVTNTLGSTPAFITFTCSGTDSNTYVNVTGY